MQALHLRPVAMMTTAPLTLHSAALLLGDGPLPGKVQVRYILLYTMGNKLQFKSLGKERYLIVSK